MKYRLVPMEFKIKAFGSIRPHDQYGCAIHDEHGAHVASAFASTKRDAKRRAAVIRDALMHDDALALRRKKPADAGKEKP